jgi:hypothetical protein
MGNIFSALFRGGESRMNQNDWAAEMFSFNGNTYPIIGYGNNTASDVESIQNDFVGYVQGAYKSSGIVFACMVARMMIFSEATFQYQKITDNGRPGDLYHTDDLSIFETPWPRGTTSELLNRAIQDTDLGGNHYVLREGYGASQRLRRFRPDWVDIILTAPPDKAVQSDVAGHVYKPGGTLNRDLWEIYPIDGSNGTVAHWSPIPDPEAQYRGMSWLTPVIREVMADKSMNLHKQKFFDNAAVPGLAVSFKESVTEEQFKAFMKVVDQNKTGSENAYKTLYLGGGADVSVIGANLQQMDFKTIQLHGETRVCAAARVHPSIAGVAEGLKGPQLNEGNFDSVKSLFGDGTMRPLWRSLCAAYAPLVASYKGARLWYDDRDIAFLRADQLNFATLRQMESSTIGALIQDGFTPASAVSAVMEHDWRILEHTGLYSVQLQPPMTGGQNANTPGGSAADVVKPSVPNQPIDGSEN